MKFKKYLLESILGRQQTYVIYICLHKAKMEAELIGNKIRADYLEKIMLLFDTDVDA